MIKDCENCYNRVTEFDAQKKILIRSCSKYPSIKVMGFVSGLINQEYVHFAPI